MIVHHTREGKLHRAVARISMTVGSQRPRLGPCLEVSSIWRVRIGWSRWLKWASRPSLYSFQTSASTHVGPYAKVVGGTVTGRRIEDHAVVTAGTASGGTVGSRSVLSNGFTVAGSAQIFTTSYPVGFYERNQGASGTAMVMGAGVCHRSEPLLDTLHVQSTG